MPSGQTLTSKRPLRSRRILAIAIVAPEARFERVLEAAAPVLDSIEFHAP